MKAILIVLCLTLGYSAKAAEKQIVMSSFAPAEASLYTRLFDHIYTECLATAWLHFQIQNRAAGPGQCGSEPGYHRRRTGSLV